jgi:hypothetical protein
MKTPFPLLIPLFLCCTLTGCFDIYQHITRDRNGIEHNTIKLTVSKTVLEMAGSMSGEKIDYDKWLGENGGEMNLDDYAEFSASIEKVNDPLDFGFLIKMSFDYRNKDVLDKINKTDASFIPKYVKNSMVIPIASLGNGDSSDNEMALVFLSTAKYRLSVSKNIVGSIAKVVIEKDNQQSEIAYLDLNDEYLVEIPIPLIMDGNIKLIIYTLV